MSKVDIQGSNLNDLVDTLVEINTELVAIQDQKEGLSISSEKYRNLLHKEIELLNEQVEVTKKLEKHCQ